MRRDAHLSSPITQRDPPIIAGHPWSEGFSWYMTAAIAGPLAASGWRMTTLDWPGHGRSSDRDPEAAIGFGELLSGVRVDRGGSQVLLGNSVGGFAAVHTAAHRPTAGCPDCTCAIAIRVSQMRSPAPRRPPGRVTPGDGL